MGLFHRTVSRRRYDIKSKRWGTITEEVARWHVDPRTLVFLAQLPFLAPYLVWDSLKERFQKRPPSDKHP